MDLARGYVLAAEGAAERSDDTWDAVVKARLAPLGVGVRSLVSDRAKARIQLAETGLACLRVPDVFHLLHALAKRDALAIFSRLRHAQQALRHAQERLATCQGSPPGGAPGQQARALVEAHAAEVQRWQGVRSDYRHPREPLSLLLHPWRLLGSIPQTSHAVAGQCQAEVTALEPVVETQGLPIKKPAWDKVRKPRAGVAALVDVGWPEVWHDGQSQVSLTPRWRGGVAEWVLPLMDGPEPLARTRCPRRQAKLGEALQAVEEAVETPPLTHQLAPEVLAGGKAWAAEHARGLQRASSAVEGRHGSLSPLHHNQRGLPQRRSKVWTVWHHCDCRASEGTTPASRCFRHALPDLLETVLSKIEDLPRSRQRNQALAISA
jgi:hypothetical protein